MQLKAYPELLTSLLDGASSASTGPHYGVRCWCTTMTQCVQVRRKFTGVGVCSPRPAGHSEFCKYLPDSFTGCVGLAANGAGPRRCTAGVTPASVRTRDRRTEARQTAPVSCAPATADHIRAFQVRRDDKLPGHPREDPLTASSGRPPERGGGGTPRRVPGPDQPQSSRAPTPILRRRGYPTVLTTRHTGREWTQRESPAPAWSSSTKERDWRVTYSNVP